MVQLNTCLNLFIVSTLIVMITLVIKKFEIEIRNM